MVGQMVPDKSLIIERLAPQLIFRMGLVHCQFHNN